MVGVLPSIRTRKSSAETLHKSRTSVNPVIPLLRIFLKVLKTYSIDAQISIFISAQFIIAKCQTQVCIYTLIDEWIRKYDIYTPKSTTLQYERIHCIILEKLIHFEILMSNEINQTHKRVNLCATTLVNYNNQVHKCIELFSLLEFWIKIYEDKDNLLHARKFLLRYVNI